MPTSFNDIFYVMDPANPPPIGTYLDIETFLVTDNNNDGDIERRGGDRVDGVDIRRAYPGDTVTIQTADGSTITTVPASQCGSCWVSHVLIGRLAR